MSWKPTGHPAIAPYLLVRDAQRTIDLLREVFGATAGRRFDDPNGGILHAELHMAGGVIMIADATEAWPPVPCMVHIYVEDVDTTYRRALDAGAEPVQEPSVREGDPDRRGGFRDPGGNTWWVATQTSG